SFDTPLRRPVVKLKLICIVRAGAVVPITPGLLGRSTKAESDGQAVGYHSPVPPATVMAQTGTPAQQYAYRGVRFYNLSVDSVSQLETCPELKPVEEPACAVRNCHA